MLKISHFSKSPRSSVKVEDDAAGRNPKAFRTPEIVSEVQGMGNSPLISEMCRCVPRVERNTSQTVPENTAQTPHVTKKKNKKSPVYCRANWIVSADLC